MINLYAVLGLESDASSEEIRIAMNGMNLEATDPDIAHEVHDVLLDDEKRPLYDLVHQQYQALSLVYTKNKAASADLVDDNHWSRRLVEFH